MTKEEGGGTSGVPKAFIRRMSSSPSASIAHLHYIKNYIILASPKSLEGKEKDLQAKEARDEGALVLEVGEDGLVSCVL